MSHLHGGSNMWPILPAGWRETHAWKLVVATPSFVGLSACIADQHTCNQVLTSKRQTSRLTVEFPVVAVGLFLLGSISPTANYYLLSYYLLSAIHHIKGFERFVVDWAVVPQWLT